MSPDYEIEAVLGEGSAGQVVKATRKADGLVVAIKMIKHVSATDYSLRKVYREISITR